MSIATATRTAGGNEIPGVGEMSLTAQALKHKQDYEAVRTLAIQEAEGQIERAQQVLIELGHTMPLPEAPKRRGRPPGSKNGTGKATAGGGKYTPVAHAIEPPLKVGMQATKTTNGGGDGSIADFIRACIRKAGPKGVTHEDLARSIEAGGLSCTPNYRYNLVGKLKSAKQIKSLAGGRFQWAQARA